MPGINQVTLVGRLGADPEIKTFANGGKIANLRVATSETWREKSTGDKKERTEWSSVVIQGDGLVGVVERFLTKGSEVALIGKLQTRKWADKDGNDRYTTEIVVGMGGQLALIGGGKGGGGSTVAAAGAADYDDGADVPF